MVLSASINPIISCPAPSKRLAALANKALSKHSNAVELSPVTLVGLAKMKTGHIDAWLDITSSWSDKAKWQFVCVSEKLFSQNYRQLSSITKAYLHVVTGPHSGWPNMSNLPTGFSKKTFLDCNGVRLNQNQE